MRVAAIARTAGQKQKAPGVPSCGTPGAFVYGRSGWLSAAG
jgi:hypothetical protein